MTTDTPREPEGWGDSVPNPETENGTTIVASEVAVVGPGDLDVMRATEMAMLDVQVTTARAFPRSVVEFRNELTELATLSREVADDCTFALPRGGKKIIGPSVRFAELVLYAYKNIVCESRLIDEGARHVVCEATARDLERNTAQRAQVTRGIVGKNGRRYADHVIETTIAAGIAIARRNAIFNIVPRALWAPIWEAAKRVASGAAGSQPFGELVDSAFAALETQGAVEARIFAYLGVKGRADVNSDDLVALRLKWKAIEAREVAVSDAFPEPRGANSEAAKASATAAAAALGGVSSPEPRVGSDPAKHDEPPGDWKLAGGGDTD